MAAFMFLKKILNTFLHYLLKGYRFPVFLSLLATIFVLWLYTTNQPAISSILNRIENLVYDQRMFLTLDPPPPAEHKIVIIDYDQRSLNVEGHWPWSRFKIGDLVSQLAGYGALVVGFDVTFPEYERNIAREAQERFSAEVTAIDPGLLPQLEELGRIMDGDRYFAEQMSTTDVVLGYSFRRNENLQNGVLPEPIINLEQSLVERLSLNQMQGYEGNVGILQNAAAGAGSFNILPDIDGVLRRTPLVQQYRNRLYPSLAMEMARLYYFEENFSLQTEMDPTGNFTTITGISMGPFTIPTDNQGQVLVPFRGVSGSYPYISATDVMRDTLSAQEQEQLRNSLVLVGTTATGLFDLRSMPLQSVYPGVEVHANVLDSILRASPAISIDSREDGAADSAMGEIISALDPARISPFPSRPDWQRGAVITFLFCLGVLLSFIYPRLGPALLALSSLTFMLGITALNFRLWSEYHLDTSLFIILLLITLIMVVNMTYGFLKEGLGKRAIKGMFDQYVPPAHIDAMLDSPDSYNFEGESKEMSVLFSDIRGFTAISESLSASELKTLLNDFFTPITGIIFEYQGTIDKYVGDMVMAFWGAPLDDPQHRSHAVAAALTMLDKVEELKKDFAARGLPEVNIGVGINSGFMNVGDMGSTYRRSYTVLGDAVNLGARLESITKFYGVRLLIGEQTYDHIDGFLCRLVDRVQVKGKEESIRIYEPLCPEDKAPDELKARVEQYSRAYKKYLKQDWDGARKAFSQLQKSEPDSLLYSIYLERIEELSGQDLPVDWDGTYRHTSK